MRSACRMSLVTGCQVKRLREAVDSALKEYLGAESAGSPRLLKRDGFVEKKVRDNPNILWFIIFYHHYPYKMSVLRVYQPVTTIFRVFCGYFLFFGHIFFQQTLAFQPVIEFWIGGDG